MSGRVVTAVSGGETGVEDERQEYTTVLSQRTVEEGMLITEEEEEAKLLELDSMEELEGMMAP